MNRILDQDDIELDTTLPDVSDWEDDSEFDDEWMDEDSEWEDDDEFLEDEGPVL